MLLDTDFVIEFHRETQTTKPRGTKLFLQSQTGKALQISLVTWMEFAEGVAVEQRLVCEAFLSTFLVLRPNAAIAWRASRIARLLKQEGRTIGDHDIWIAATALEYDEPLVTRNLRHFQRVQGLELLTY